MPLKVTKFGGTSLADAKQIEKACEIILSDKDRRIIVLSAPGKRYEEDIKVTDLLIKCANDVINKSDSFSITDAITPILNRFEDIIKGLKIDENLLLEIKNDLIKKIQSYNGNDCIFMALMKAAGEDNMAKVIAECLKKKGVNAAYINPKDIGLYLSDDSTVLEESYTNLKKLKDFKGISVVPGFFGYSKTGNVITFPRGGSDITGSIVASAVNADIYENFTDVDFVFTVDPKYVENPKPIYCLTYDEMWKLSHAGFSVLHEETLGPVEKKGIPINIKNTNNPFSTGTIISKEKIDNQSLVSGITCRSGFCRINISSYIIYNEVEYIEKILQILRDKGISYEHMASEIHNFSILMREDRFPKEIEEKVIGEIKKEFDSINISIERELAVIMLVGEGMKGDIKIIKEVVDSLVDKNINICMINQELSGISLMIILNKKDVNIAIKSLYDKLFN